jgi:hypothetical protein
LDLFFGHELLVSLWLFLFLQFDRGGTNVVSQTEGKLLAEAGLVIDELEDGSTFSFLWEAVDVLFILGIFT